MVRPTERRVCQGTLAAETYTSSSTVEAGDWLRAVLVETRAQDFRAACWAEAVSSREVIGSSTPRASKT
eukprot:12887422-Prorocentrum_lima.AAC.1